MKLLLNGLRVIHLWIWCTVRRDVAWTWDMQWTDAAGNRANCRMTWWSLLVVSRVRQRQLLSIALAVHASRLVCNWQWAVIDLSVEANVYLSCIVQSWQAQCLCDSDAGNARPAAVPPNTLTSYTAIAYKWVTCKRLSDGRFSDVSQQCSALHSRSRPLHDITKLFYCGCKWICCCKCHKLINVSIFDNYVHCAL